MTEDLPIETEHDDPVAVMQDAHEGLSVLVVGDLSLQETIKRLFEQEQIEGDVDFVEGYLLALGHLAAHTTSVVIGSMQGLDESLEETVNSLRELAPHAHLVVVCSADQESMAKQAVRAGFDEYLIQPVPDAALLNALTGESHHQLDTPTDTPDIPPDIPPEIAPDTLDTPEDPPASDTPLGVSLDDAAQIPDAVEPAPSSSAGSGVTDQDRPILALEAGDGELVERLLQERRDLQVAAIGLIRQRSGLSGVNWAEQPRDVPVDQAWVPVQYRRQALGVLYAPRPVTGEQLRPWARWLARWLALDRVTTQLWDMALKDELTGAWNRRYFSRFFATVLEQACRDRFHVTLLLFDLDDFKSFNHQFGSQAGDDLLGDLVTLMQSTVREHDVVARLEDDQLALLIWDASPQPRRPNSEHPSDPAQAAQRLRRAIASNAFPKLGDQAPGALTIAGSLASYPWDGRTADELLVVAQQRMQLAKQQGVHVVTVGGVQESSGDEATV